MPVDTAAEETAAAGGGGSGAVGGALGGGDVGEIDCDEDDRESCGDCGRVCPSLDGGNGGTVKTSPVPGALGLGGNADKATLGGDAGRPSVSVVVLDSAFTLSSAFVSASLASSRSRYFSKSSSLPSRSANVDGWRGLSIFVRCV